MINTTFMVLFGMVAAIAFTKESYGIGVIAILACLDFMIRGAIDYWIEKHK